ncbi:unnamed protein product [Rotaria sp. Silwood1]|nr:unnamed protein product [Rotaria sp. Silwood1]CAF3815349.1 unnamed protein product [Rotaria sp. Silwood1]CAF3845178.1 unnamed protein product [Rotaria sp. Silwood1]CAF3917489.1 unnamed protein product [Rotaria sp. Silwood1]CAF4822881.1 unnamed protein product [Rotaria sp. Silwood1]
MSHKSSSRSAIFTSAQMGFICLMLAVPLFIIGGYIYRLYRPKELYYKESSCLVLAVSYRNHTCHTRYSKFQCFAATWDVLLDKELLSRIKATVESVIKYQSVNDALANTVTHEINASYSCWYDTREPTVAQWRKPSARIARILFTFGGVSILITIFFALLAIYFAKKGSDGIYSLTAS